MDAAEIAQAVREFDPIAAQIKAMSAIDVTAGGALVPPPQQGRKRIRPARLGQSKTLLALGKGWYEAKAAGTCKPGQNPERDKCTAATDDPAQQRPAGSQTKPAKKAEVAEVAEPAQKTGEETAPPETASPEQVDTSDAQFEKEWAATVEKAMAEVEQNDVASFPFDAQQTAAEQDWHKQYIEWRWGLTTGPDGQSNKGKYKPTEMDVGAASRFVSGLLNPVLGGASYVAQLYDRFIKPRAKTHKPADPAIGDELQAYFDQLNPGQNNKQTAEVAAAVLGPEAVPVVKALAKVKPPEPAAPLTQEQLMAMTPAERSRAVAAERAARQRPKTELRQAAAASQTKPSKPNAANRVQVAQRRGQAKERKRQNETPEQRSARIAKERAANIARRKKQEARMAKYRKQDAKEAERAKKKAGKKHLLFQSKTLSLLTKGRWVTMPANGEGGGGSPVYIGEGGEIEKGPAGTVGKKPDQLENKKPKQEEKPAAKKPESKPEPENSDKNEVEQTNTSQVETSETAKPAAPSKPEATSVGQPVVMDDAIPPQMAEAAKAAVALGPKEKKAVLDYTNTGYKAINGAMRSCPPDFKCVSGKEKKTMEAIEKAIASAPPFKEPVTVYRGMSVPPAVAKQLLAVAQKTQESGGEFTMPSITSTTLLPRIPMYSFARDKAGEESLMFQIKAKRGLYVKDISLMPHEQEVLQSAQTRYKVVGIADTDFSDDKNTFKKKVIYLEEV